MSYEINPSKWNKIFAVPAEVVDSYIKLAGSAQLKVLLWLLRHCSEDFDEARMSADTGIALADARDAMQFWAETGMILKTEPDKSLVTEHNSPASKAKSEAPEVIEPEKFSLCDKPTNEDVAARGEESQDIRYLWNETQQKLGKTLSFNDQRTLLWFHDHWGLPIEVILMIVEYCASVKKTNMAFIEKVGLNWANEEIFSVELAEKKLSSIKRRESVWKKLCADFGMQNLLPTAKQAEYLDIWLNQFGFKFDIVHEAFEECINRTSKININYINKVLENWHGKGFKTLKQVKEGSAQKTTKSTSYSLEEFEQAALNKPIIYKKKGEN